MRRPDLCAVDHVVVAVPACPTAKCGKVGTRARLGVSLTPIVFPRTDPGQEELLLPGRPEVNEEGAAHLQPGCRECGRFSRGTLLLENVALQRSPPDATKFEGPHRCDPALLEQHAMPGSPYRSRRENACLAGTLSPKLRGQRAVQERAHLVAECVEVCFDRSFHRGPSGLLCGVEMRYVRRE